MIDIEHYSHNDNFKKLCSRIYSGSVISLDPIVVFFKSEVQSRNVLIKILFQGGLSTVLDLLLVKEMIHTCFKKRPHKTRIRMLLLILANSLAIFILYGQMNLDYLYTRNKLEWDLKQYTVYSAAGTTLIVLGLLIGTTLFQKVCRVSDLPMSIVSYLSCIGEVITKALAVKSWHMYFGEYLLL